MVKSLAQGKQREKLTEIQEKVLDPLIKQEKYEKALKIAKANLETLGPLVQFLSAVIHDLATEPETAIQILGTLSSRDPKNMKYPNEIGRIELKRGNIEEARKSFEKADQIAPLNIDRLEQMASLYLQTMNTEKAAEKYAEILAVSPSNLN